MRYNRTEDFQNYLTTSNSKLYKMLNFNILQKKCRKFVILKFPETLFFRIRIITKNL